MLKSAFSTVKYIHGSVTNRLVFASATNSSVRLIGTARTVFNKETDHMSDMRHTFKTTKLQKFILVVAGLYRKPSDVPDRVSHLQMKRAHDAYRTRIMIALMIIGSFLCYLAMVSGRRLRDSGYSLEDEGEKQVAIWKEKGRLELEAQKKKSAE